MWWGWSPFLASQLVSYSFLFVGFLVCSVVKMARKMLDNGDLEKYDEGEAHYDFDLFVIGAGSGGVRASRFSAQYGAKVIVVLIMEL